MDKLKFWLKGNERSGSWLARKLAVSPVAVSYWLKGTHTPSAKHRKKIQKITGIKL